MAVLLHSLRRRSMKPRPSHTAPLPVSLPLEIEFRIIDQFEGDTFQLRKFCLVSSAWASYVQSLLFHDVYVRYHNVKRFLAVLQPRSQLGRYITTLDIIEGGDWVQRDGRLSVLDSVRPLLAERLANVHTLDLSYSRFGRDAAIAPVPGWGGISRLHVRFCTFATTDTMVAFIASFPRLESLDIFQCSTQDVGAGRKPAQVQSAILMPAWHLKYLALGEFPQSALIDWMIAEPAEIAVDHFRILSLGPDASSFNALLEKIGGELLHLELPGMHHWISGPEVALSIRACTALTTLSFSERSAYDLGRGIIAMLSQVTSPYVSTVSFQIPLNTGYLDILWEEIEDVLTTDAFGRLEAVVFNMLGGPFEYAVLTPYDEAVLLMEDRMVILDARGMLRFKYADDTAKLRLFFLPRQLAPLTLRQRVSRRIAGWMDRRRSRNVYVNLLTV
ncbi:hypothetical protein B0H19DRAFT_1233264 [Mycena capillaripes]|nr:hypothetical protein B0H19DRAFT_1233264 [Mycena capillaripes]